MGTKNLFIQLVSAKTGTRSQPMSGTVAQLCQDLRSFLDKESIRDDYVLVLLEMYEQEPDTLSVSTAPLMLISTFIDYLEAKENA